MGLEVQPGMIPQSPLGTAPVWTSPRPLSMGPGHVAAILSPMSTDHTADAPGPGTGPRTSRSWCSCGPVLGRVPRSSAASDSKAHPGLMAQCPTLLYCRRGCESIYHFQNSLGGESLNL